MHDSTSFSREDSLDECGRPCDSLSCLLFSALWLRCNQSLLVQETQSAKDILTCFETFPIKAATCLQVGPMALDWPVDPIARSDFSRPSLPPEVPSGEQQLRAFSRFFSFPLETRCSSSTTAVITTYYRVGWMWPLPFRRLAMYYLEHQGPGWFCFSRQRSREFKLKHLKRLFDTNNIICLQEVHGKDEFLQAIQVLASRFRLFGTLIPGNENAGGSAKCIHIDLLA